MANLKYPNELYDKVVEYCSPEILNEIYQSVLEEKNSDALLISDIKTGLDYEIFIEQILKNADFTVTRTPKTGDQGVDLVVQKMINVSPFNVNTIQNLLAIKLFKKLLLEKIFIIAIVLV